MDAPRTLSIPDSFRLLTKYSLSALLRTTTPFIISGEMPRVIAISLPRVARIMGKNASGEELYPKGVGPLSKREYLKTHTNRFGLRPEDQ